MSLPSSSAFKAMQPATSRSSPVRTLPKCPPTPFQPPPKSTMPMPHLCSHLPQETNTVWHHHPWTTCSSNCRQLLSELILLSRKLIMLCRTLQIYSSVQREVKKTSKLPSCKEMRKNNNENHKQVATCISISGTLYLGFRFYGSWQNEPYVYLNHGCIATTFRLSSPFYLLWIGESWVSKRYLGIFLSPPPPFDDPKFYDHLDLQIWKKQVTTNTHRMRKNIHFWGYFTS